MNFSVKLQNFLRSGEEFFLLKIFLVIELENFISVIFFGFLFLIAWIDFKTLMIYDKILIPMACVGIFFDAENFLIPTEEAFFYFALTFVLMFAIFKISREGMGGGDVKFSAVLALWLGEKIFSAIFFASIFAALFAIIFLLKKRGVKKLKLPFAPFLSAGSFFAYLIS